MLKGCHEEALMENNQQVFDLQVFVPKCLATYLNDQKYMFVHNAMVAPIEYFQEHSKSYPENDVTNQAMKHGKIAVVNE